LKKKCKENGNTPAMIMKERLELRNQKTERIMNGIAIWTAFYRANPHRFVKEYLNVNLKLFQKILLLILGSISHIAK